MQQQNTIIFQLENATPKRPANFKEMSPSYSIINNNRELNFPNLQKTTDYLRRNAKPYELVKRILQKVKFQSTFSLGQPKNLDVIFNKYDNQDSKYTKLICIKNTNLNSLNTINNTDINKQNKNKLSSYILKPKGHSPSNLTFNESDKEEKEYLIRNPSNKKGLTSKKENKINIRQSFNKSLRLISSKNKESTNKRRMTSNLIGKSDSNSNKENQKDDIYCKSLLKEKNSNLFNYNKNGGNFENMNYEMKKHSYISGGKVEFRNKNGTYEFIKKFKTKEIKLIQSIWRGYHLRKELINKIENSFKFEVAIIHIEKKIKRKVFRILKKNINLILAKKSEKESEGCQLESNPLNLKINSLIVNKKPKNIIVSNTKKENSNIKSNLTNNSKIQVNNKDIKANGFYNIDNYKNDEKTIHQYNNNINNNKNKLNSFSKQENPKSKISNSQLNINQYTINKANQHCVINENKRNFNTPKNKNNSTKSIKLPETQTKSINANNFEEIQNHLSISAINNNKMIGKENSSTIISSHFSIFNENNINIQKNEKKLLISNEITIIFENPLKNVTKNLEIENPNKFQIDKIYDNLKENNLKNKIVNNESVNLFSLYEKKDWKNKNTITINSNINFEFDSNENYNRKNIWNGKLSLNYCNSEQFESSFNSQLSSTSEDLKKFNNTPPTQKRIDSSILLNQLLKFNNNKLEQHSNLSSFSIIPLKTNSKNLLMSSEMNDITPFSTSIKMHDEEEDEVNNHKNSPLLPQVLNKLFYKTNSTKDSKCENNKINESIVSSEGNNIINLKAVSSSFEIIDNKNKEYPYEEKDKPFSDSLLNSHQYSFSYYKSKPLHTNYGKVLYAYKSNEKWFNLIVSNEIIDEQFIPLESNYAKSKHNRNTIINNPLKQLTHLLILSELFSLRKTFLHWNQKSNKKKSTITQLIIKRSKINDIAILKKYFMKLKKEKNMNNLQFDSTFDRKRLKHSSTKNNALFFINDGKNEVKQYTSYGREIKVRKSFCHVNNSMINEKLKLYKKMKIVKRNLTYANLDEIYLTRSTKQFINKRIFLIFNIKKYYAKWKMSSIQYNNEVLYLIHLLAVKKKNKKMKNINLGVIKFYFLKWCYIFRNIPRPLILKYDK